MGNNLRFINGTNDKIAIRYDGEEYILPASGYADIQKRKASHALVIESRPESGPTSGFKRLKRIKNAKRRFFGKYETSVAFCCRLTAEFDIGKLKSDTVNVRQTWCHCFHYAIVYSRFLLSPHCKAVHVLPDEKAKRKITIHIIVSAVLTLLLSAVFLLLGAFLCEKLADKRFAVLFLLAPLLIFGYGYSAYRWLKFRSIEKHPEVLKDDSDYVEFEKVTPKVIVLKDEADGPQEDPDFVG